MNKKSQGIIFLSGAGLESWIWDGVIAELNMPSVVADYSRISGRVSASLNDYVQAALESANRLPTDTIIIVAHSIGGVVGSELAKRLGNRVVGFVGISAAIPQSGSNFFSCLPFPQRLIMPLVVTISGTKPPESAVRTGLASGVDAATTSNIVSSFQPETKGLYRDKTTATKLPDIPYAYIRTTVDKELPLSVQNSIVKRLPNPIVHDIKSGHLPMLTHAAEVTDVIRRLF